MSLAAFLNPFFLWGAALFAVPLLIHLLNRRRYRTVTWAAMEFVLAAYKKKHRRMRLENLLLLLLRCAIPVLLALALARPFFGPDSPGSILGDTKQQLVVVVDHSYSMNRKVGTGSAYQASLSQIRRLFGFLRPDEGDAVSIVVMGRTPRVELGLSSNPGDWESALNRLSSPSYEEADFAGTVDLLKEHVEQIPSLTDVYFFSDFQRRSFEDPLDSEEAEGDGYQSVKDKLKGLFEHARLHLIDVAGGATGTENLSVVDLRAAENLAIVEQNLRFTATVRSTGELKPTQVLGGRFRIGDVEKSVSFQLDADGTALPEVYHSFSEPGDYAVSFELDEDDLEVDNVRSLRVPVRHSIPLLVVDGDPQGADELEGEAGELLLVLDPLYGDLEGDQFRRYFEPKWIAHHDFNLGRERLDEYDAILLANVRELDHERMVPELENYVRRGGGVWFFLGDQVAPDSYNLRLYRPDGSGLMPLPMAEQPVGFEKSLTARDRDPGSFYRMQVSEELHPAVRTFVDDSRKKYLEAPVFRYLPFDEEEPAPQGLRVPLRFQENGAAALLDHSLGRGHAMWFVTAADDAWSLFGENANSFFPFYWDVVSYLVRTDPSTHQLGIGDAIRKSVPFAPTPFTITKPDGKVREITDVQSEPELGHFPLPAFGETDLPGLYTLDLPLDTGEPVRELFAVNVDPDEGELASLSRDELSSLLSPLEFDYDTEITEESAQSEAQRQGEIWRMLVMALLGMLLLETVLAWRFGAYS